MREETLISEKAPETELESVFDQPTDRSGRSVSPSGRFAGMSTEELRRRMFAAAREGARFEEAKAIREELQARASVRRVEERDREEQRQRWEQHVETAAAATGYQCDLTAQGCPCQGRLDREHLHQEFLEQLRRPAVSAETVQRVAVLLGYPPAGLRMKRIFSYTRDGGPPVAGFEWAAGASEEDWLELMEFVAAKMGTAAAPRRNPIDGGISEGWVRVVLQQVIERARARTGNAAKKEGG